MLLGLLRSQLDLGAQIRLIRGGLLSGLVLFGVISQYLPCEWRHQLFGHYWQGYAEQEVGGLAGGGEDAHPLCCFVNGALVLVGIDAVDVELTLVGRELALLLQALQLLLPLLPPVLARGVGTPGTLRRLLLLRRTPLGDSSSTAGRVACPSEDQKDLVAHLEGENVDEGEVRLYCTRTLLNQAVLSIVPPS